ncbi:MAG: UvrD-helicase domain-containing protein [Candidatus Eremiobacteraeota bacterium]|nr:UvrD-helicase domain-containing protein [Candidatus Eremiobacteraeota bacterium]
MNDAEARRRIVTDLESNFLVEASAGSGKTHCLVARLVAGVTRGRYPIERIAAVTFTRKAAAELSARLRLELEKSASPALARFPEMFVGTVHSFCGQLLREYPVQSGISPAFREIEQREDETLQRRVLRSHLEDAEGRRLVRLLAEYGASWLELLPALYGLSEQSDLDYLQPPAERPCSETIWRAVENFSALLQPQLPACAGEPTCKLLLLGQRLLQQVRLSSRESARDLIKLLSDWETNPKPVKRYWGEKRALQNAALEAVTPLVDEFRSTVVAPALAGWRAHLYAQCLPFLLRVRQACQEERRQLGLSNFQDLLRKCARLLRNHPEVVERLQERFQHLYVDEFQDTDPLQAEIFLRLAADSSSLSNWLEGRPRPASLFLVGDPKQSIYRFRRADMRMYYRVRQSMGAVLELTTSFRSNASICAWVNRVFAELLPARASQEQAPFAPLTPGHGCATSPAIYRLTLDSQRHTELPALEARQLAAFISASPYTPGDFLILTSRIGELAIYQKALQELGIPYRSSGEPRPLEAHGRSFLALLRSLAHPGDSIALTSVLRGKFFGHSDTELFLHRQAGGELRLGLGETGAEELMPSLAILENLSARIRSLSPGAAAHLVMAELGLTWLDGYDELEAIADELTERGEAGLTLLQGVVELLEADQIQPRNLHSGQRDAVRIMNLHKAKGLEAKVVFLAAPAQGLPLQVDHALTPEGAGVFCLRRYRKLLAHPPGWHQLAEQELAYLSAERLRLLYVATTRAREMLVVSGWSGSHGAANCPWLPLAPFLSECPELQIPPPSDKYRRVWPEMEAGDFQAARDTRRAAREHCRQASWKRSAVTTNNKTSGFRSTLPLDASEGQGRDWGDLIHRLLEYTARHPDCSRDQLHQLARWFSLETPQLAPFLEAALDVIERVQATEFWSCVRQARQRLVEIPFGRRQDDHLILGIIDLLLSQPDGWDLIDYKTDRKRLHELLVAYSQQIGEYAHSWNTITGESVRSAGIFGVREGAYGTL